MTASGTLSLRPIRVLRRERLVDRALDAIKDHIIASNLRAGDRLPTESELTQSLGVSRNVVRQALSSLEAVGIVRTEHGRGTFVAEMGAASNALHHLGFWLDIEHLGQDEYIEARSVFDAGVFRLVMDRATDQELEHLRCIVEDMAAATDEADMQRCHDAFHAALLDATHNNFLSSLGMILYRFFWGLAASAPNVRQVPVDRHASLHRRLVDGLVSRDGSCLSELIALHLGAVPAAERRPKDSDA